MTELARVFLEIALRRRGPEDLPASPFLLALALIVYLALQLPLALIATDGAGKAWVMLLVDIALSVGAVGLLLSLAGYGNRFGQTLTAMLGTGALLTALSLPFNFWDRLIGGPATDSRLPAIFVLGILLWSFVVDGHIVSRALSRPFVIGLVIAMVLFLLKAVLLFEIIEAPG